MPLYTWVESNLASRFAQLAYVMRPCVSGQVQVSGKMLSNWDGNRALEC